MKMFLISDNVDTMTGMRLAGIEGTVVHERDEFVAAVKSAADNPEIGLLLITVKLSKLAPEYIDDIKLNYKRPLIVEIPDRHGAGKSDDFISKYVSEAIGLKL